MSSADLIAEIETFLALSGVEMAETTFGRLAVNDGKFVPELRRGRRIWPDTAEKVRKFIREYPRTAAALTQPGEAA